MDFVVLVSKDIKLFLVYVNFGGGGGILIYFLEYFFKF